VVPYQRQQRQQPDKAAEKHHHLVRQRLRQHAHARTDGGEQQAGANHIERAAPEIVVARHRR
jgi:hypothetical protein